MGEFRFATLFFVFGYLFVVVVTWSVIASLGAPAAIRNALLLLVLGALVGGHFVEHRDRLERFYANPVVPFDYVVERYGRFFNRLASHLELEDASILLPDLGGTLYYSQLRVYDLAGLTDRTIARTLQKDQAAFYDYVFEEIRPTFIHTHGIWTVLAQLASDPRFHRDYTALRQYEEPAARLLLERRLRSGDWIRREALEGREEQLRSFQGE